MKKIRLIILVCAMMTFAIACQSNTKKTDTPSGSETEFADNAQYTCPMHPEVLSDGPGSCPKCGMNLEKVTDKAADSTNFPVMDTI